MTRSSKRHAVLIVNVFARAVFYVVVAVAVVVVCLFVCEHCKKKPSLSAAVFAPDVSMSVAVCTDLALTTFEATANEMKTR